MRRHVDPAIHPASAHVLTLRETLCMARARQARRLGHSLNTRACPLRVHSDSTRMSNARNNKSGEGGEMRCPQCQYDLRGLPDGVCPECGRPAYRFTDRAREVMIEANRHAIELLEHRSPDQPRSPWWRAIVPPDPRIRPFHLLMGLTTGPQGIGYHALVQAGIDPGELRRTIGRSSPIAGRSSIPPNAKLPTHRFFKPLIKQAINEAYSLGNAWVGTEHLLLAVLGSRDRVIKRAARERGVELVRVRSFIVANSENLARDQVAR